MPHDTIERLTYGMNTVKCNAVNTNKAYFIALFAFSFYFRGKTGIHLC